MEHADLEELYQTVILDHSRSPRNFGPMPDASITVDGDNPTCGDEVHLHVRFSEEGKLEKISFTGSGCSICLASASLMTIKVKGKPRAEAEAMLADFQGMITGATPGPPPKTLGDLRLLAGVKKFPQRVKCATLAWHALRGALSEVPVTKSAAADGIQLEAGGKIVMSTEADGQGISLG